MAETPSGEPGSSNRTCLILALAAAALLALACVIAVVVLIALLPARVTPGGTPPGPGTLPELIRPQPAPAEPVAPDARVSLEVLSDGCAVERGDVTGGDGVSRLTWVIMDTMGVPVLERNAQNEYRYRYWVEGTFTASVKAWYAGAYWTISDVVEITCP